ncbi:unnamed protein product [Trichogramma brassicae]|uniref:Uncharacterized protein n=1 Tax=Trichogramma brassicae TaxID=86971 RepID=A0A6H5I9M1_9HYME|nr:unnamed protein product [Trichogramma brassicae]
MTEHPQECVPFFLTWPVISGIYSFQASTHHQTSLMENSSTLLLFYEHHPRKARARDLHHHCPGDFYLAWSTSVDAERNETRATTLPGRNSPPSNLYCGILLNTGNTPTFHRCTGLLGSWISPSQRQHLSFPSYIMVAPKARITLTRRHWGTSSNTNSGEMDSNVYHAVGNYGSGKWDTTIKRRHPAGSEVHQIQHR